MDDDLSRLAAAHGVATGYEDGARRWVSVEPDVVLAVLERLGVPASTPEQRSASLAAAGNAVPEVIPVRQGTPRAVPVVGVLHTEDGAALPVDGSLPADLPLGWHRLVGAHGESTVVVAPPQLPRPPAAWGWAVQLYALRSPESWGMGDFGDLRDFAVGTAAEFGADAVLVNPLHAITPVHPVQASPYSPSSRRFANPLYLRVTDTVAYRSAPADLHDAVDALAPDSVSTVDDNAVDDNTVDYDAVWTAKRAALALLFDAGFDDGFEVPAELREFATFCALAEEHGGDWRDWPAGSHVDEHAVRFHAWLQSLCAGQQADAQRAAEDAGMRIGVLTDLAVGIAADGADAWALGDVLAHGVTIGAPPDAFNQRGQNWSLVPWDPRGLAAAGYRPFAEMLRAQLRHAGGIRIDHVAGLWRLWWIPDGVDPTRGTYVHYDAETLLAILALEAHRAGAVVIGEDLGTVTDEVSEALREQRMLGCAVAWFQRAEPDVHGAEPLLRPEKWPEQAVATISTHDLPTAAGFLRGEHVRIRAELDQLGAPVEEERARAATERAELLELLRAEGLLDSDDPAEQDVIVALHALLARTPCRLLLASPYDVLAVAEQPNLPGTVDEYPNWRRPLPVTVAEFLADPRVAAAVAPLRAARPRK